MAIARIQSVASNGTGANPSITITSAGAGHLLVCSLRISLALAGVTNPGGYSLASSKDCSHVTQCLVLLYKIAAGGETSIAFTASAANWQLYATEWSGVNQTTPFTSTEHKEADTGSVSSIQPGSLTPGKSGELFVIVAGRNGTGTAQAIDSGFTLDDIGARIDGSYKVKTDALAENPTDSWTTAQQALAVMAAFNPAAIDVTGVVAAVTLAAPVGAVSVAVAGPVANIALATPAGLVALAVAGPVASVTTAAPAGTVAISVAGVIGAITTTAPSGTVTYGNAVVGAATGLALVAPSGTVAVAVAGQPSDLTFMAVAGSVDTGGTSTAVAGLAAVLAITAPAGLIVYGISTGFVVVGETTEAGITYTAPAGRVAELRDGAVTSAKEFVPQPS